MMTLQTLHKYGIRSKFIVRPQFVDLMGNHKVYTHIAGECARRRQVTRIGLCKRTSLLSPPLVRGEVARRGGGGGEAAHTTHKGSVGPFLRSETRATYLWGGGRPTVNEIDPGRLPIIGI